jgi:hypothetical protein
MYRCSGHVITSAKCCRYSESSLVGRGEGFYRQGTSSLWSSWKEFNLLIGSKMSFPSRLMPSPQFGGLRNLFNGDRLNSTLQLRGVGPKRCGYLYFLSYFKIDLCIVVIHRIVYCRITVKYKSSWCSLRLILLSRMFLRPQCHLQGPTLMIQHINYLKFLFKLFSATFLYINYIMQYLLYCCV